MAISNGDEIIKSGIKGSRSLCNWVLTFSCIYSLPSQLESMRMTIDRWVNVFLSKQSFKKQTYKKKLLYIYLHSYNTDLCLKSSKSSTELSLQGTQSLLGNTL